MSHNPHNTSYPSEITSINHRHGLLQQQVQELERELHRLTLLYQQEREWAEEALVRLERYERLLHSISDYIYTVHVEQGQPVATVHGPGCVAVTGYNTEDYAADPKLWLEMVPPEDRPAVVDQAVRILANQEAATLEHRIVHKNGSIRWVRNTPVPHHDQDGNLIAYDGLITDITAIKDAEAALRSTHTMLEQQVQERTAELRAREEHYRALVHNASDLVSITDERGIVRYISPSVERILGYRPEDMVGHRSFEFLHPDDLQRISQSFATKAANQSIHAPNEMRFRHKDGSWRYLETVLTNLLHDPAVGGMVTNARDVTTRKEFETELRASEKRFRNFVQNSPDAIFVLDMQDNNKVVFFNRQEFCGYSWEELSAPGSILHAIHADDHATACAYFDQLRTARDAAVRTLDYRLWRKDGGLEWLRSRATPLEQTATGEWRQVLLALTLITERKQAEEQRVLLSQAMQQANDGVLIVAAHLDGSEPQVIFANQSLLQMSGYAADDHDTAVSALPSDVLLMFGARHKPCEKSESQDEQCIILGQFPRVVYGTVEDPSMRAHLHRLLNLGEPCGGETSIRRCDGSISYIEWHISPIRVQHEQVTHFISLQRDVTASKRTEMLSGDQRAVLEATISGEPLLTVFDRLMQLLERQRPHMQAAFWALHDGRLINRAARRLSEEYILAVQNYAVNKVDETPCGAAVQQRQSIIIPDSANDEHWPGWCEIAQAHQVVACWTTPVMDGSGAVLGVLALYATQPLYPTTNDLLLLDTTSQLMALALEQRQLNDQIVYHTSHDTLTHLPNRTGFIEQVQQALHQAQEHDNLVAICFIDLDRFKQINDTLGHAVGDEILSQAAARFSEAVQPPDTLARIGDDTFALLLTHPRTIQDAMRSAQHLQTMLIMPFAIGTRELFITASIGISIYPQDGTDTHTLLRNADNAMHRAKTSGFNTVMCFTPQMTSLAVERLDLEHQLRLALERGDLRLHYQPQIDVTSGRIIGVEALMRWQHPERGMVSPGQFIPLAEESGLIVPIGFWALTEACRQAVAWQQAGLPPIRVAVNVSAVQLAQEDFVDHVQSALLQSGLHPNLLELEMTESVLMSDREAYGQRLKELRALGVRVSIDDFGTGYSSLAYLHHFPVDGLKIDQSFVRIIDTEPTGMTDPRALVQGIATLARSFRLRVIAEGVENREQLDFLSQIDCDEAQGFLFAPALPAPELYALLSAQEQETPHALPWADSFAAWQPD